jgi:hypothetical protein
METRACGCPLIVLNFIEPTLSGVLPYARSDHLRVEVTFPQGNCVPWMDCFHGAENVAGVIVFRSLFGEIGCGGFINKQRHKSLRRMREKAKGSPYVVLRQGAFFVVGKHVSSTTVGTHPLMTPEFFERNFDYGGSDDLSPITWIEAVWNIRPARLIAENGEWFGMGHFCA